MAYFAIFIVVVLCLFVTAVWYQVEEDKKLSAMSPEEREQYKQKKLDASDRLSYGPVSPQMICPHCQTKGKVRTKEIEKKAGVSGGKATAAILTGGISLLATGLSRKEDLTQAHCGNCTSTWTF